MSSQESKQIMAKNIKKYMEIKGVTNQQLCEDLGFKYTTFMDWIKAVTYPRIGKIEAMAQYFGCEKSDLIEDKKRIATSSYPEQAVQLQTQIKELFSGFLHYKSNSQHNNLDLLDFLTVLRILLQNCPTDESASAEAQILYDGLLSLVEIINEADGFTLGGKPLNDNVKTALSSILNPLLNNPLLKDDESSK